MKVYEIYKKYRFFAYSGNDGDLYRNAKLKGWRISDYGSQNVRIQQKINVEWRTIYEWGEWLKRELTNKELKDIENKIKQILGVE